MAQAVMLALVSALIATDPMPPEQNDLYIFYKPEADWGSASGAPTDKQGLIDGIRKAEGRFDHQTFEFAQPIQMRFNEMLEGTKGDISVKIFGEDCDVLDTAAAKAKKILQGIPGTADVAALIVNLSSSDLEGYVQKARAAFAQRLHLPASYRIEFGGQFHQLEQARARLSIVVPAALAMIFVLVWFALGSVRRALIVYTGIPFAVTGGVLALWLRGMPFSITAAIGFIALSGIAMLNGLVMIDHIGSLREGDDACDLDAAVRRGAHDRLRPVLATAFCASIGFVPMAIATGAGAEVQRPLATVVIGGIITSTCLTLLLLPSLYRWVEAKNSSAS